MLESELKGHVRSKTLLELDKLRRYIIQHWDQPEGCMSVKTLSQRFACSPSLSKIRAYAFGGKENTCTIGNVQPHTGTSTIRPLDKHAYDYTTIDNSGINMPGREDDDNTIFKNIFLICVGLITVVSLASCVYILHVYSINL